MGMSPLDIRKFLEGYCMDETVATAKSGTLVSGSDTISVDTSGLMTSMKVTGQGIPNNSYVVEVTEGQVKITNPVTASGVKALNFINFEQISDEWLINTRDFMVMPVVERMVGFPLTGTKRVTEFHSGTGSSLLILNRRPIIDVYSVNLVTNPQNWIYVSPNSLEQIKEEGILKLRAVLETWQNYVPAFPRGKDNIKIDYEYGYAQAPDDLARAVVMLTASFALGFIGSRTGGGSLNVQGYGRNYGARGKFTDVRSDLDKYAYSICKKYVSGMIGG